MNSGSPLDPTYTDLIDLRCSYPNTTIALPTITKLRIMVPAYDYTAEQLMEVLTVNAVAAAPVARSWPAYSL
ncbi:hypothetical protein MSAN_02466900 [Mycena sanguinolenta]|uniref:Uncharacterized protein n=1 Tax=Mycena sanguinolenta TaxID=230812 RepID=A0A8H6WWV3_9AGAR|nr:hypothetical protein MSAN_02466900 [Mycena sanguinolenta]